jgi:hypothetical protein
MVKGEEICATLASFFAELDSFAGARLTGAGNKPKRRGIRDLQAVITSRDDARMARSRPSGVVPDAIIERSSADSGFTIDQLSDALEDAKPLMLSKDFSTPDDLIAIFAEALRPSATFPPATAAPIAVPLGPTPFGSNIAGSTTKTVLTSGGITAGMGKLISDAVDEIQTAKAAVGIVDAEDTHDIRELVEIFAYQGFDARYLRSAFMDKAESLGRDAISDAIVICTLIATMGTNTDKGKGGITESAKKIVDDLLGAEKGYGFHTGAMNAHGLNKRTTMTTNRMGHVFPEVMFNIMCRSPDHFEPTGMVSGVPKWVCFPGFLSLVPNIKSEAVLSLVILHLKFSDEFNKVVSKVGKGSQTSRQAAKSTSDTDWQELAWTSNLFSSGERVAILQSCITDQKIINIAEDYRLLSGTADGSYGFSLADVRALIASNRPVSLANLTSAPAITMTSGPAPAPAPAAAASTSSGATT